MKAFVRNFLSVAVMAVMLAVAVPTTSLGQDRNGRWRGRGNGDNSDWSRRNRKCRKFRNCHDARDGRWDGRGPRRDDRRGQYLPAQPTKP